MSIKNNHRSGWIATSNFQLSWNHHKNQQWETRKAKKQEKNNMGSKNYTYYTVCGRWIMTRDSIWNKLNNSNPKNLSGPIWFSLKQQNHMAYLSLHEKKEKKERIAWQYPSVAKKNPNAHHPYGFNQRSYGNIQFTISAAGLDLSLLQHPNPTV